jgi:long-subunit acyl-CoA synthetase (AMP-forming)
MTKVLIHLSHDYDNRFFNDKFMERKGRLKYILILFVKGYTQPALHVTIMRIFSLEIEGIQSQLTQDIKLFKWSSTPTPTRDGSYLNNLIDISPASLPRMSEKPGYNDKLMYIYTSGTTGLPKAAIITNVR